MKELAQTFLILGGGLGLFIAVPAAIYGWFARGSGPDTSTLVYSPLVCLVALVTGLVWRKRQTRKAPRTAPKLTEDGGAFNEASHYD